MTEQRSEEWYKQRVGRITASSVGAILGHSQFQTKESILRRMVRDYHQMENEFEGNSATAWGVLNEAGAIAEFTMETGFQVTPAPFVPFEHWAGASPDGYVQYGGLIEVKCPYKFRKDPNPDFLPASEQKQYFDQMQFQMYCTGENTCYFYQWALNGTKLELVKRSAHWSKFAIPVLFDFYKYYLDEIENPDHLKPKRQVINTSEAKKLIDEYDELNEAQDRAKNRKSEILEKLVELTNGKDSIVAGRNLTKTTRTGIINYSKAIKDLAPDADLSVWKGRDVEFWRLF